MSAQEPIDATLAAADAPPPDSDKKPDDPPKLNAPAWKYALRRAAREFSTDGGTDLSAMLTYYTVLSLAPALLAVFSIISLVLASNAASVNAQAGELVGRYVPADYRGPVVDLVNNVTGSPSGGVVALVISLAVALWSASAYVKAFSRCMNVIYSRAEGRGVVKQIGTMLLVTLTLLVGVVLILVSLALNQALVSGVLGPIAGPLGLGGALDFMLRTFLPVWAWVKWPVIIALVVVLVAVLYYFTPNVRQPKFSWMSLGSVVAIVGIAVAAVLLSIYLTRFAGYSSYGAVGSMMALLFALWVFNIMLLLGAEVDAEVERARELQAGFEAEGNILLPPRDTGRVEKMKEVRDRLEADGRELRTPQDDRAAGGDGSGPTNGQHEAEQQGKGAPAKLRAEQERRFAGERRGSARDRSHGHSDH